jgi:hypothetical protein
VFIQEEKFSGTLSVEKVMTAEEVVEINRHKDYRSLNGTSRLPNSVKRL